LSPVFSPTSSKPFEREKTHSNALIEAQQATNPTWLGKKSGLHNVANIEQYQN
jgi:hypothetical protein